MVAKLVTDSTEWPGFNLNFDPYCVLSPSLQSIDHGSKSWTSPKTNHWFGDAIYVKQADRILSTLLPGGHIGRKMVERKEIGDPGQNQDEMRRGGCHFMQWPITWQSITTVLCYHPVILVIPSPMHALLGSNQLAVEARASALDLSKLEGNVLTRRAEHLYSWSGIRPSNLVLLALVSISKTCKGSRNLVFKYSPPTDSLAFHSYQLPPGCQKVKSSTQALTLYQHSLPLYRHHHPWCSCLHLIMEREENENIIAFQHTFTFLISWPMSGVCKYPEHG